MIRDNPPTFCLKLLQVDVINISLGSAKVTPVFVEHENVGTCPVSTMLTSCLCSAVYSLCKCSGSGIWPIEVTFRAGGFYSQLSVSRAWLLAGWETRTGKVGVRGFKSPSPPSHAPTTAVWVNCEYDWQKGVTLSRTPFDYEIMMVKNSEYLGLIVSLRPPSCKRFSECGRQNRAELISLWGSTVRLPDHFICIVCSLEALAHAETLWSAVLT